MESGSGSCAHRRTRPPGRLCGPRPGLEEAGAEAIEVRKPEPSLAGLDGLILPGGESTTFLKFLERDGFLESLQHFRGCRSRPSAPVPVVFSWPAMSTHPAAAESGSQWTSAWNATPMDRQIDSAIQTGETRLPGGPAGDGVHPCPAHSQCGTRSRSTGGKGRISRPGTARQVAGGHLPPGTLRRSPRTSILCGHGT